MFEHAAGGRYGRALIRSSRHALAESQLLIEQTRARLAEDPLLQQVSVLPPVPEPVPSAVAVWVADLEVAGRYVPVANGNGPVAGDFYDVLRTGPDRVALVVGDVSGHGPTALERMQVLRAATRAVALQGLGARAALAVLDLFVDEQPGEGLATLWYGEYVPSSGRLVYASAGHPPPVLAVPGEVAALLALADAPPLGTGLAHALAAEHRVELPTGAALVAYSDGLVERPDADWTDQLAVLRGLVAVHTDPDLQSSAEDVADAVLHSLVPDRDAALDDVALLVVRRRRDVPGRSSPGQSG